MDIDEDRSGDDVSKESEDDEKTPRYVLLNQVFLFVYISSYRPVAIWVSPSYAKVSCTLRKPPDLDTNILLLSLPMVSLISPQWASEVTFISYESEFTRIRSYKHPNLQIDRERFNGVLYKL